MVMALKIHSNPQRKVTKKPQPQWGWRRAEAPPSLQDFRFEPKIRGDLKDRLQKKGIHVDVIARFLVALEYEVGQYRVGEYVERRRPTLGQMRAAYKVLASDVKKLTKHLSQLDERSSIHLNMTLGNTLRDNVSRVLTRPFSDQYEITDNRDAMLALLHYLAHANATAIGLTKLGPRGGPREKYARKGFVRAVAELYQEHLGKKPAATESGLFVEIIERCLEAAKTPTKDVREVVRQALNESADDPRPWW